MLGAVSRYIISGIFQNYETIPLGTLFVNVFGSFALGVIITMFNLEMISSIWIPLAGVGFMGSFTTMSSFAVETMKLTENALEMALFNLLVMMILVFCGVFLGKTVTLLTYTRIGINS